MFRQIVTIFSPGFFQFLPIKLKKPFEYRYIFLFLQYVVDDIDPPNKSFLSTTPPLHGRRGKLSQTLIGHNFYYINSSLLSNISKIRKTTVSLTFWQGRNS